MPNIADMVLETEDARGNAELLKQIGGAIVELLPLAAPKGSPTGPSLSSPTRRFRFRLRGTNPKIAPRNLKIDSAQFGKKAGKHLQDYGKNPGSKVDRQWLEEHIHEIHRNPSQIREGTFAGQGAVTANGSNARGDVRFYIRGNDVVVADKADNFVTILKDGISNTSVQNARVVAQ